MNQFRKALFIILVATVAATTAFATSKTASITVTATVTAGCSISANPLGFGAYDPLGVNATADVNQQTTVRVQCVGEVPATVTLDEGQNKLTGSTPTVPLRQMQCVDSNGDYLAYFLYQDASHTKIWGANGNAFAFTGDGTAHDYTVYGVIPKAQMSEFGGFSDLVVATVTW